MEKSILFNSIKRNLSGLSLADGACQEIINLRNEYGEWNTMYPPKEFLDKSTVPNIKDFTHWHLHQVNGKDNYWYFYNGKVYYLNADVADPIEALALTEQVWNVATGDLTVIIARLGGINGVSFTLTINGTPRVFTFVTEPDDSGLQLKALWIPDWIETTGYQGWMDLIISQLNASIYIEPYFTVSCTTIIPDNPPITFTDKGTNTISATVNAFILSILTNEAGWFSDEPVYLNVSKIASFGDYIIINNATDRIYIRYDIDTGTYIKLEDLQHGRYAFNDEEPGGVPYIIKSSSTGAAVISNDDDYYRDCQTEIKSRISLANKDGKAQGHTYFIVAFRTLGNEYIFPSTPIYHYLGAPKIDTWGFNDVPSTPEFTYYSIKRRWLDNQTKYGYYAGIFCRPVFDYKFTSEQLDTIKSYGSLITSVCVFMSKPHYDKNFFASDDECDRSGLGVEQVWDYYFPDNGDVNDLFKTTSSFYLVHEIENDSILTAGSPVIVIDDIEGIETKDTLPVDNSTHHKLIANSIYDYNSRLHLANIITRLGNGHNLTIPDKIESAHIINFTAFHASYDSDDEQNLWAVIKLKTKEGTKTVLHKYDNVAIFKTSNDSKFINLSPLLTYPDSRAISIQFIKIDDGQFLYKNLYWVDTAGVLTLLEGLATYSLYKHPLLNIAHINPSVTKFDNQGIAVSSIGVYHRIFQYINLPFSAVEQILPEQEDNRMINDCNRVQVSDLNNPLLFPAINSYRIGDVNNNIIGIISQAVPLSQGQFGRFPLYIFTKFGIFTLEQGNSEVLYASIQPLSQDVCNNAAGIASIKGGVFFPAIDGLKVISGAQVLDVSNPLDGNIKTTIQNLSEYIALLNGSKGTGNISAHTSTVNFNTFLLDAIIGYDNENDEIWITNTKEVAGATVYKYSYVLNLQTKTWSKSSSYFDNFIQTKEFLTALKVGVFYNTATFDVAATKVLIVSQPIKFDSLSLKTIERLLLRMEAPVSLTNNKALYLFGSLNGIEWKLINGAIYKTGVQLGLKNIRVTAKYFIVVFASNDLSTTITQLDASFKLKIREKLR